MNYLNRIQKSIDFIEANLQSDISLIQVAEKAYFSLYHFHRIFQAVVGESVKEYIRKRRITEAANELANTNERILDIALKYQYQTHESFTRAFYKMFGVLPSSYRKSTSNNKTLQLVNIFDNIYKLNLNNKLVGPEVIFKDQFNLIGLKLNTSKENEKDFKQIENFWYSFFKNNSGEKIPGKIDKGTYYGYSTDFDENLNYSYIICCEVSNFVKAPKGMVLKNIPASKYLKFKVKGELPGTLINAWRYLYGLWLPTSDYELKDATDFDVFNQEFLSKEVPEVEVLIPIK